jgi:hypothetical protein
MAKVLALLWLYADLKKVMTSDVSAHDDLVTSLMFNSAYDIT